MHVSLEMRAKDPQAVLSEYWSYILYMTSGLSRRAAKTRASLRVHRLARVFAVHMCELSLFTWCVRLSWLWQTDIGNEDQYIVYSTEILTTWNYLQLWWGWISIRMYFTHRFLNLHLHVTNWRHALRCNAEENGLFWISSICKVVVYNLTKM